MKAKKATALALSGVLAFSLMACNTAGLVETNPPESTGVIEEVDLTETGMPQIDPAAYTGKFDLNSPEDLEVTNIEDELVALTESPVAVPNFLMPEASGTKTKANNRAVIDYSHTEDGYVMAKFTGQTTQKLKVQVIGPTTTYTYNINPGQYETFPLSDGNGLYKIVVYENTTGTKYATVVSVQVQVTLADEFAPFLRPNQYVNYENAPETMAKGQELVSGQDHILNKVAAVYDYVVQNITYDKQLAKTVQSGYLPDLDAVLAKKSGICFDYAALMTAMLRSQGIPCKLVVGYAGTTYHAWISVYSEETGWMENVVFFDGTSWQRMDPTFASSQNSSTAILKYIGDGSHYTVKYLY